MPNLPSKLFLAPGPWTVTGNTVKDGAGRTVAVVFAKQATAHAYWIAEIPEIADTIEDGAKKSELRAELERAGHRVRDADRQLSELQAENRLLKARLAVLEKAE